MELEFQSKSPDDPGWGVWPLLPLTSSEERAHCKGLCSFQLAFKSLWLEIVQSQWVDVSTRPNWLACGLPTQGELLVRVFCLKHMWKRIIVLDRQRTRREKEGRNGMERRRESGKEGWRREGGRWKAGRREKLGWSKGKRKEHYRGKIERMEGRERKKTKRDVAGKRSD